MLILGIETSFDDTALALVSGQEVLSSVRWSQKDHASWGGVVPELAARGHQEHWSEVLNELFVVYLSLCNLFFIEAEGRNFWVCVRDP